jgi:hypothetical protein
VYQNTLEESALDLIGAKMKAAMVFYGDEVGGALVDDGARSNLLNDVVRKAMGKLKVGRAEAIFSIGNGQVVTESPLGSPTAASPRMAMTLFEMAEMLATSQAAPKKVRSPSAKRISGSTAPQLSLFG